MPVLFTCGTADPVVDYSLTKRSGEMVAEALGEAVSGATTAPRSSAHLRYTSVLTQPSSLPRSLPPLAMFGLIRRLSSRRRRPA